MAHSPLISIIIPVFNQAAFLRDAVQLAVQNAGVPKDQYEVVISDDNSDDAATVALLKELAQKYKVVYNKWQRGFPGNVNYGVAQNNHNRYICLLNSDTRACTDWLKHLLETIEEDDAIGIVGAKLLYPKNHPEYPGLVQHAGVARNASGYPYHAYREATSNAPDVNIRREINCVTFACAMIRHDCWNEIGGLDVAYGRGNCEDVDFCWTARSKGWKIVYQPKAQLYHWEHGSFGEKLVASVAGANFRRLVEKWRHLDSDEFLFCPLNLSKMEDVRAFLYETLHACRARSMAYVYESKDARHIEHCKRLATMGFHNLPKVEVDWLGEWAEAIIRRLGDRQ
jgi:GT2 family glycosyltransferase